MIDLIITNIIVFSAPLQYLDRIKITQMDSLRQFVSRVESTFQHSMTLSMFKKGGELSQLHKERAANAAQMAYKTLRTSLAGIAKVFTS